MQNNANESIIKKHIFEPDPSIYGKVLVYADAHSDELSVMSAHPL